MQRLTILESQVGSICALIKEGALFNATKLFLPRGLADCQDPSVEEKLRALHPTASPHLLGGANLTSFKESLMGEVTGADTEEPNGGQRACDAIRSFPPGLKGGPSGLSPVHLKDSCRKLREVSS